MHRLSSSVILLLFIGSSITLKAAWLRGTVRESSGNPLPFVNLVVKGTSIGTTANSEGYFRMELTPGKYELAFSMIGFRQRTETVQLPSEGLSMDVVMEAESYRLRELTVKADAEDPAYEIIRQAQRKREYYREKVPAYTCHAYVKSTQRLTAYPKRFMGQKIDIGNELDTTTGIFYLSESVSDIAIRRPDDMKEVMVSSKVSGSPKTYSFNRGADLVRFSLYDPLVDFSGLTPRGILSPIGPSALFNYKFRLEGTFTENNRLVHRIEVIPRRIHDPVFTGWLYIVEGEWRVHSSDLFITRNQSLQFLDTFRIRQYHVPLEGGLWMPSQTQLGLHFNLFGFVGDGDIVGVFSDYDLDTALTAKDFNGEVLRVDESSNTKDSSYWSAFRPVPLTAAEIRDYSRSDSVYQVEESRPYRDSVDKASNRFAGGAIIAGYRHQNSYKHNDWSIRSPLTEVQFNTVQGWTVGLGGEFNHRQEREGRSIWSVSPEVRYGFATERFYGKVSARWNYDPMVIGRWSFQAGSEAVQFNGNNPITPAVNSAYSLISRLNYMKLYQEDYVELAQRSEWINGVNLTFSTRYSYRSPLENRSDYSFSRSDREYTSNDPVLLDQDTVTVEPHAALLFRFNFKWTPGQRYVTRPEGKWIDDDSPWPTFAFNFREGIPLAEQSPDFTYLYGSLEDRVTWGLLGELNYRVGAGKYLRKSVLPFMDWTHFNGNQTILSGFGLSDFMHLDYYAYSTNTAFWEVHAEQHFKGFLLNKLPLIRRLRLNEIISAHHFTLQGGTSHTEFGLGFEKLNIFRVQLYFVYEEQKLQSPGLVLGIKQLF